MDIVKFPVSSTNIFPIANSTAGGQLLTEFNLRSRETVGTDSNVPSELEIGPSYTHSMRDFEVSANGAVLTVSPGKALLNGHFVQSLVPINIDMLEELAKLSSSEVTSYTGNLTIGIRVMYSNLPTMAGTVRTEKDEQSGEITNYYQGLHFVILPTAKALTPSDIYRDGGVVLGSDGNYTMHIKLATFNYRNGEIYDLLQNTNKIHLLDGERIGNIDNIISDQFISSSGLREDTMYVFNPSTTSNNGWINANDSLIKWSIAAKPTLTSEPGPQTARFERIGDSVRLALPHLQIPDYKLNGASKYIPTTYLTIPQASGHYPGILGSEYIERINELSRKLDSMYSGMFTSGAKMIRYVEQLEDRTIISSLNSSTGLNVGDYVLVGLDLTANNEDLSRPCSTLYVVEPGFITAVGNLVTVRPVGGIPVADIYDTELPSGSDGDTWQSREIRGTTSDYVIVRYSQDDTQHESPEYVAGDIQGYRKVSAVGSPSFNVEYPVYITAPIPLAYEDTIGGFLNVSDTSLGQGYVYRDDNGNLKLLDYDLLVTGVLAYRLSEDVSTYSYELSEIQAELDEYVNNRVAFKDSLSQSIDDDLISTIPNVVNVTVTITDETEEGSIYIYHVDSRFGTYVNLTIDGTSASNEVHVYISDIEKLKLNLTLSDKVFIHINRCGLYYDAATLNLLQPWYTYDLTYWYAKLNQTDPDLVVEGDTIRYSGPVPQPENSSGDTDWWAPLEPDGQNQLFYGVSNISLSNRGEVVGCELCIVDQITQGNHSDGRTANISELSINSGLSFPLPYAKFNYAMNIGTSFNSGYWDASTRRYYVHDVSVSAHLSPFYSGTSATTSIPMYVTEVINSYTIPSSNITSTNPSITDVPGWSTGPVFATGRATMDESK